jgi:hypothetical protein
VSLAFVVVFTLSFFERPRWNLAGRFQIPLPDKITLEEFDVAVVSPDGQRMGVRDLHGTIRQSSFFVALILT